MKPLLSEGDNIIISQMEHHANIVPWQLITKEKKAEIKEFVRVVKQETFSETDAQSEEKKLDT